MRRRPEAGRLTPETPPPEDLDDEARQWWTVVVSLLETAGRLGAANPLLVRTAAQLCRTVDETYRATVQEGVSYKCESEDRPTRYYRRPEAEAFATFNKQLRETLKQLGLDDLGEQPDPLAGLRGQLGQLAGDGRRN